MLTSSHEETTEEKAGGTDLKEGRTEGLEYAFGQGGLGAVSEGTGQEEGGLLLDGGILVVHHAQDVL